MSALGAASLKGHTLCLLLAALDRPVSERRAVGFAARYGAQRRDLAVLPPLPAGSALQLLLAELKCPFRFYADYDE